jgi:hypothetical protein
MRMVLPQINLIEGSALDERRTNRRAGKRERETLRIVVLIHDRHFASVALGCFAQPGVESGELGFLVRPEGLVRLLPG